MDFDPQGSTLRWVRKRKPAQAPIHVIAAFEKDTRTTRAFQLRVPDAATHVVVDTPAALDSRQLADMTRDADKIIVPVLPSDIDIHACSRCIRDLLLVAKIRRDEDRIGSSQPHPPQYAHLPGADPLPAHPGDPIVATIRDSQNYLRAAELGIGVHEMKSYLAQEDVAQWVPLVEWLARPAGAAPAPRGLPRRMPARRLATGSRSAAGGGSQAVAVRAASRRSSTPDRRRGRAS